MASKALDEHTEGGEPVEVEPGNSPQYDELGSSSLSDEMKKFTAAMASINLGDVAIYASQIWKSIHPDKPAEAFGVTELGSPIFGWNNMLYPVIFEDGVRWLLKIPENGTRNQFSDEDAESLRSEFLKSTLLAKEGRCSSTTKIDSLASAP